MRTSALVLALTVAATVAGCGSSDADQTAELRDYLSEHHAEDTGYDGLGVVEVRDGDVVVNLGEWNSPDYGAYLVCDWVSEWLYLSDAGSEDSRVVVERDGDTLLERRSKGEDCEAASLRAGQGS